MGTYDWMELQTLTNDIAAARARLAAARATKDIGKARGLEEEIGRAEAQRDRLLAHITTNLVTAPEPPANRGGKDAQPDAGPPVEPAAPAGAADVPLAASAPSETPEPVADAETSPPPQDQAPPEEEAAPAAPPEDAEVPPAPIPEPRAEELFPETAERDVATGAAPPAPAPQAASAEGGKNMWDQLKPSDIERAKQDLVTRRNEMLARHAEELRGLDADHAELDGLEQAITAFLQKFSATGAAGVVKLDAERELRQQTAG
jgi:hypothetical protein